MKTFKHYFLVSLVVIFTSCQQNDVEADDPSGSLENQEGYSLSIPDGFNFSTERKVRLNITDATPYVRYQVFGYSSTIGSEAENISDAFNNLLYTGEPYNGSANFELSISNIYDKVYVSRNDGGESSFEIIDISDNRIDISHRSLSTPSNTNNGNRRGSPTELYYPGGTNEANLGFEDLWPSQGDYDFNDLVISYRIVFHLNIDGNIDSMDYIYDVTNIGASYNNGFGIEFPWDAALYTVTGQRDSGSGGETSENGSVVRFFDNANLYLDTPQTLTITFTTAQDASIVSAPPYNPFITANGDTNYEVHLAGELYTGTTQPATFPGFAPSFAQANNDANGDYIVDAGVELNVPPLTDMGGMPWAINIAGTYVPPLPGEFIMKGHLKFLDWAQSGGEDFPDWFMDVSGYRDSSYLEEPATPPSTVPDAPTIGTAVAGDGLASVSFTAPLDDGGSAITGYTATSLPGGFTGTLSQAGFGTITVSGLTNGTAYTFSVIATNAIGTSTSSAASNSVTPQAPAVIGDLRDGGVVFWVDPADNTHGLVCALSDYATTVAWGCFGTDLPNVPNVPYNGGNPADSGAEIGDGFNNTIDILTDCPSAPAAIAARSLGTEWFLPSAKELNQMYINKTTLEDAAGFTAFSDFYWSSTEFGSDSAWFQNFGNGNQFNYGKDYPLGSVRAVRAF
jgi:LruC domain-containing protein